MYEKSYAQKFIKYNIIFNPIYLWYSYSQRTTFRSLGLHERVIHTMNIKSKNKRIIKISFLLLLSIMSVIVGTSLCNATAKSQEWTLESMRSLLSNTESKNCIICKHLNLYSNEDNLGIICLNDDESYHVGINRYDDYGNLITKKNTSSQMLYAPANSLRKGVQITTDTNRGYAKVDISLAENKNIDMQKATYTCCTDCLSKLQEEYYSQEPYDIVVLNYKTKEVRLLSPNLLSFLIGDFYVSFEQRASVGETEISDVDLLIFYCPERYQ